MKLKDFKRAELVFAKLIEAFPKNHMVMGYLAQCCFEQNEFEKAQNWALKALEIFADWEDAIKILKKIKEKREQKDE